MKRHEEETPTTPLHEEAIPGVRGSSALVKREQAALRSAFASLAGSALGVGLFFGWHALDRVRRASGLAEGAGWGRLGREAVGAGMIAAGALLTAVMFALLIAWTRTWLPRFVREVRDRPGAIAWAYVREGSFAKTARYTVVMRLADGASCSLAVPSARDAHRVLAAIALRTPYARIGYNGTGCLAHA